MESVLSIIIWELLYSSPTDSLVIGILQSNSNEIMHGITSPKRKEIYYLLQQGRYSGINVFINEMTGSRTAFSSNLNIICSIISYLFSQVHTDLISWFSSQNNRKPISCECVVRLQYIVKKACSLQLFFKSTYSDTG